METTGYVSSVATPEVLHAMTADHTDHTVNAAYFFGSAGRHAHLNPIMYPDSAVIARCAMIHDAGEHTPEVIDMWSKVKGDNLGGGVVVILLGAIALLSLYVGYRRYTRYRHQRLSRRHRRHHVIRLKR